MPAEVEPGDHSGDRLVHSPGPARRCIFAAVFVNDLRNPPESLPPPENKYIKEHLSEYLLIQKRRDRGSFWSGRVLCQTSLYVCIFYGVFFTANFGGGRPPAVECVWRARAARDRFRACSLDLAVLLFIQERIKEPDLSAFTLTFTPEPHPR